MAKPGRNDPCPCGSGQKYKRCCLPKDEAAESAALKAAAETQAAQAARHEHDPLYCDCGGVLEEVEDDELTRDSNAAVDLVHAGKLAEAERAAHQLIERYPEVHDGYDRLGMVYEARGERKAAADCYRKVIAFIQAHPDQYEPGYTEQFEQMVAELDPPSAD